MSKELLAVDVDEVLFPFLQEFSNYHNEMYNTQLSPRNFFTYDSEQVLEVPISEAVDRVMAFHDQGYGGVTPIEGSVEGIRRLSRDFELAVVTARPPEYAEETNQWLKSHYGDVFADVLVVGHKDTTKNYRLKAEVCRDIGAAVLIDDSPQHITDCLREGIGGVLFGDYAWNQTADALVDELRCADWRTVERSLSL